MEERELIKNLHEGSYEAFDALYELYAQRLYGFCLSYRLPVEVAEDIVQDTFTQLWYSRGGIRVVDSLAPLIFTIAKNRIVNNYKKEMNSRFYAEYANSFSNEMSCLSDSLLEFHEYEDLLKKRFALLPKTQRRAVILSHFEGLTNREISEKLHLSEQTVKNQLSLGTKALKDILK